MMYRISKLAMSTTVSHVHFNDTLSVEETFRHIVNEFLLFKCKYITGLNFQI